MSDQPASPWRERLASPLTWHYAGFAVLLLVVIGLGVRLGLDWAATNSRSNDALAGKQVELKAMDLQTAPLRGLDKIQDFYARRIPPTYSAVSAQIGELEVKTGVRLSRLQYSQGKPGANLTEISLDAGISGEYPDIMKFINSLERDQTFFVIRAMQLAGQQGGQVNLRLRVSTWLRPMDAALADCRPRPHCAKTARRRRPTLGRTTPLLQGRYPTPLIRLALRHWPDRTPLQRRVNNHGPRNGNRE
jgi:type IV pilus assembly protein PilO